MSENHDLKSAGLKVTLPRLRVLELLEGSKVSHMSAEEVYRALHDQGEEVGLATVYRVLTQFESAGIVIRHNFDGDRSVFELAKEHHHDHIVCLDCGEVVEFTDDKIEELQERVAKKHHFTLEDHSLYLYGRCNKKQCKNKP